LALHLLLHTALVARNASVKPHLAKQCRSHCCKVAVNSALCKASTKNTQVLSFNASPVMELSTGTVVSSSITRLNKKKVTALRSNSLNKIFHNNKFYFLSNIENNFKKSVYVF
jgi:hypothetical protein